MLKDFLKVYVFHLFERRKEERDKNLLLADLLTARPGQPEPQAENAV